MAHRSCDSGAAPQFGCATPQAYVARDRHMKLAGAFSQMPLDLQTGETPQPTGQAVGVSGYTPDTNSEECLNEGGLYLNLNFNPRISSDTTVLI